MIVPHIVPNIRPGYVCRTPKVAVPITTFNDRITASDYVDILGNQVHPVVQMFSNKDAILKDDNSPTHTQNRKCSVLV